MIKKITKWIDHCKFKKDPKLWFKLIDEEYKEVRQAILAKATTQTGDLSHVVTPIDWGDDTGDKELLKELGDLIWVSVGMIHNMGYDPEVVIQKIVDSNNSKFCSTQAEALESITKIQEEKGVECYAENVAPRVWVIRRKSDDKVMKGINYESVKWED